MFKEEGFQYLCKLDELTENSGKRFIVNDIEIAVFKIDSTVFALSNICPHQQTHLIPRGPARVGPLCVRAERQAELGR